MESVVPFVGRDLVLQEEALPTVSKHQQRKRKRNELKKERRLEQQQLKKRRKLDESAKSNMCIHPFA
jgi:hypothetical protein